MVNQHKERLCSIDLLRTLAIVLVVIFHFLFEFIYDTSLRYLGFIGISLFFIISGFVLAKKYPDKERFSSRWFLKRYIKIASLYYLALVAVIILFQKQVYSGSLMKNLFLNAFFLGFLSPDSIYGIISPAWFLTPLIALYILFPYLNRYTKKYKWFLVAVFLAVLLFRILNGALTSFSPLFFMGEFCFGISLAHEKGRKISPLAISFIMIFFMPVMFIPFILFYLTYSLNLKFLPSVWKVIGENTLVVFLFHEALINIIIGRWHIFQLNIYHGLFLMIIAIISLVYISKKIQKFIFSKNFFVKPPGKRILSLNKKSKVKQMDKKIEIFLVIVAIIILAAYAFCILSDQLISASEGFEGLGTLRSNLLGDAGAVLTVSDVSTSQNTDLGCQTVIKGKVSNKGIYDVANVILDCKQSVFPMLTKGEKKEVSKNLGTINKGQETSFEIVVNDCEVKRFECSIS